MTISTTGHKPLVNQELIGRLSIHIMNKNLSLAKRIGYCELATLAGMLYLPDAFPDFIDLTNYDFTATEVYRNRIHFEE